MQRTKINFRALREMVGISQRTLADLLDVDVRSVKRWENPNATAYRGAPNEAWELLLRILNKQEGDVDEFLEFAADSGSIAGDIPRELAVPYYHDESDYEVGHPGNGRFWQVANATSRRIAYALRDEGYPFSFIIAL